MAQLGADPDQLDELGRQLSSWSERLSGVGTGIDGAVASAFWKGPDAVAFHGNWRTSLRPQLGRVSASLTVLARRVAREAERQRQASSADGGGPAAPVTTPTPYGPEAPTSFPGLGDDVDELTPSQRLLLAERFAPVLEFQDTERYQLGDPEDFLDESELIRVKVKNNWWDDVTTTLGQGEVDGYELQGLDDDYEWHLDHDDGDGPREGGYDDARMLYEVHESAEHGPQVTYWLFYPYNDGPGPQNHEGDWERISVDLDGAYQPQGVAYSGHGSPTWREWDDVEQRDGRPVGYVAQGTHANYPSPGEWDTDAPGPIDESAEGGVEVDLADMSPVDVSQADYYGSDAHWGERGESEHTSGPTGPGAKGALRDHDELNEDQPNDPWYEPFRSFVAPPQYR